MRFVMRETAQFGPVVALSLALIAFGPAAAQTAAQPAAAAPTGEAPAPAALAEPAFDRKAVADFYHGKTIRLVVGTAAGASWDRLARLMARILPKYIPGSPIIVVENQPAAGGRVSANQLYNTSPKDGTAIATFSPSFALEQLLGSDGVTFDITKFTFLGSLQSSTMACYAMASANVRSPADLRTAGGREWRMGSLGPGVGGHDYMAVMRELGFPLRLVTGYTGAQPIFLAMEQGEIDGTCLTWEGTRTTRPDLFEGPNPKAVQWLQFGLSRSPNLPNVTLIEEVLTSDTHKAMFRALAAQEAIQRPFALPPGVPPDRVAALRAAFAQTVRDPDFLAATERTRDTISAKTGVEVEQTIQEILRLPKPVVDELRRIIRPSSANR